MSACDHFTQNAWRPDLCSTCQRAKSEHDGISGPRSWRRKSEPNPNNAISGVRISALASKFQAREIKAGSIPETERARTLDRKTTRNKDKVTTSHSTELLDSSVSSPPLLTSTTSASTSAITNSSKQSSELILETSHARFDGFKSKGPIFVSRTLSQPSSATSSSSATSASLGTYASAVADGCSDNNTPQRAAKLKPVKLTSSATNSNQGTARTTALPSGAGRESSQLPPSGLGSAATNSNQGTARTTALPSGAGRESSQLPPSGLGSAATNSNQGTARTTALPSGAGRESSQLPPSGLGSAATKSNSSSKESTKKLSATSIKLPSATSLSSSSVKSQQAVTLKDVQTPSNKKVPRLKQNRRVVISDLEPQVIGYDGGLDNLFPDEESTSGEDNEHIYFSLTDEEKQFALLALGNTVWNSDTRNLQVETEGTKRSCREFEDLSVDQLWSKDRFKSLVDCDFIKRRQVSGTYPQISASKMSKVSVKNLSFTTEGGRLDQHENKSKSVCLADGDNFVGDRASGKANSCRSKGQGHAGVEWLKTASLGSSGMTSLSSDSEGRMNYGSNCSSADSGVEMGGTGVNADLKEQSVSYTTSDGIDLLYKSSDGLRLADVDDGEPQNLSEKSILDLKVNGGDKVQDTPQARSRSGSSQKNLDQSAQAVPSPRLSLKEGESHPNGMNASLDDNTAQDGFQAVALLNDVLRDYGDFNESSTDDYGGVKDERKDSLKGKKSTEFEARMATVAASLDLTKQRAKRQAPRPPVSPPPEPNLAEAVSPKKVVNQPDPVFKMVTVGKSIVTLPPQQDMPPMNSKPAIVSYGLEDFGSLPEISESINGKTNGEGKSKKGISSFFRNILRRGRDSAESFESANPDVQLHVKMEKKDEAGACGSEDLADDDPASSSVDLKLGPKSSSSAKFLVMPPSPSQKRRDNECLASSDAGCGDGALKSERGTATASSTSLAVAATSEASVKASPPVQRKTSKGLASPKLALRKATTKFSPPTCHRSIKTQEIEDDVLASSSTKAYPAPKPVAPSPGKPITTSTSDIPSSTAAAAGFITKDTEPTPVPNVGSRQSKSPKRIAPPVPPTRTSAGTGGGTLSRSELRESTRRLMPVPPSPPAEKREKVSTTGSWSPPVSPIREIPTSLPSSPSWTTGASFDFPVTEWSGGSTSTIDDELPKFSEKIELPTVATQGRKGFLGKLGGNRKSRAPQPPVKRAKSVTQSSTLPRGDKKSKKINVADISGPVIVVDVTNVTVLENRRHTISLGDEPALAAMSGSALHSGGTNSSTSVDKSGFDEFDFPVLSPLGSLENLYESILPKPEGTLFHYYDPPTSPKVLCPNIPSDGYLEPVPPLSSMAAAVTTLTPFSPSSLPATLSAASTTPAHLSSSSSTSSASSATTNASVVKSPLKSRTSRNERTPNCLTTNPRDDVSSHSSQTTSTSSSQTNSAENSGNSLPDSTQMSPQSLSETLVSTSKRGSIVNSLSPTSGLGPHFVEPEMTEQRRLLLSSQPIYEEIPNGGDEDFDDYEDEDFNRRSVENMVDSKTDVSSKSAVSSDSGLFGHRVTLPSTGTVEVTKSQVSHIWLQQSHFVTPSAQAPSSSAASLTSTLLPSSSSSVAAVPSSPSHNLSKQNLGPSSMSSSSSLSMTSSQIMSSSLMSTSLTSSMLPPPPPPPDHLSAPHFSISCSASRETVSSESDTQSNCSNDAHSNCSTLSRPRPAPRRKPHRPETGTQDQYVSMNRPNTQVLLSEDTLRDVFTKLTSITFHALQDIYAQCEKILSVDRLYIPNSKTLKWADFDIYGQPLHASGRCVVYNSKLRANDCPCQIMILHSRPATEMCTTSHPSLLRPSAVFADAIPFAFLTRDFIKTSQLLQNSVYDSSQARCFVAVGSFDIVESLDSHLALLRETLAQDLNSYLSVILIATLQLLSAMSHCLDQGFSVTETDYSDVFLVTRSDLRGKVVAFLPRQRSLDMPQGEAMCNFLNRLLTDSMPDGENGEEDDDQDDDIDDEDEEKIISAPRKVALKLMSLLEPKKVECLGQVRTAVEYLLWGPAQSELSLSSAGVRTKLGGRAKSGGGASSEQELYVWLEKERLSTVGRLARNVPGLGAGLSLEEFYTLKFLLKSSAGCLAESSRRLSG